jgi:hypothetical protein
MTTWRIVRVAAGLMILLSLLLGVGQSPLYHSVNWLWLTVFVGANLLQSGLTDWCLLERILARLGVRREGAGC